MTPCVAVLLAAATLSTRDIVAQAPAAPPVRIAQTFTLPPGKPVVIEATVGDVTITAWARPEIDVQIERRAEKGADLARIDPRLEEQPDALFVSARQVDGPPDRRLRVSITMRAPAATVFKSVQLLDGRISLEGLRGSISADLRNGTIEGSRLAGTVRLETGFGDVEVRQAELTPGGLLRLRAFNGNATLRLAAAPSDARILALSFNGTIVSDIPLTMKETFGPRFGETTIGRGEPVISMDVVYGDIVIKVERRE